MNFTCMGCKKEFKSKNRLFAHLRTSISCLSAPPTSSNTTITTASSSKKKDADLITLLVNPDVKKWTSRWCIIYGYDSTSITLNLPPHSVGTLVSTTLHTLILRLCFSLLSPTSPPSSIAESVDAILKRSNVKFSHTYSTRLRSGGNPDIFSMSNNGKVLTEMMAFKVPFNLSDSQKRTVLTSAESSLCSTFGSGNAWLHLKIPECNVLGNFMPESSANCRRVEFVVPADLLCRGGKLKGVEGERWGGLTSTTEAWVWGEGGGEEDKKEGTEEVRGELLEFFNELKGRMQEFKDGRVEDEEESDGNEKDDEEDDEVEDGEDTGDNAPTRKRSNRRSYHNYTSSSSGLPQRIECQRRIFKFSHKGTYLHLHAPSSTPVPFIVLGINADSFLKGMENRYIAAFLATLLLPSELQKQVAPFLLDPDYPSLTEVAEFPSFGAIWGDNSYTSQEGRSKVILRPRRGGKLGGVFSGREAFEEVGKRRKECVEKVCEEWCREGLEGGTTKRGKKWMEEVLKPWVWGGLSKDLKTYLKWKENGRNFKFLNSSLTTSLSSISTTIPKLYNDTLVALRRIAEEEWPGTTVGRRTVIVEEGKSFSAVMKEKELVRSSRVEPSENHNPNSSQSDTTKRSKVGDGKGGSFSVGYMPCSTRGSNMPASNSRYPELVRAAFLLERALMPERPPSSTIAVNRNAQFRPHTDSGAGAGQSKSLIVALGNYAGGELVVEDQVVDIRYEPVEFDGWKQRHYTKQFVGERFSLVWFTPKGCENMRGVDL